jgi:hypothetical protein
MHMTEFMQCDLLARGWTLGQIKKMLGEPDRTVSRWGGGKIKLFAAERVTAGEQSDEYKTWQERRRPQDPKCCDLLVATFAVNRAAKRWRDASQRYYRSEMKALASSAKKKKESLYNLKDRGICNALQAGRISAIERHAGLCLYEGSGYRFHSTLTPKGIELPERDADRPILIEAKPQGSREPRQMDAIATLEGLSIDYSLFDVLAMPTPARRVITCWNCGEEGHLARHCYESVGAFDSDFSSVA